MMRVVQQYVSAKIGQLSHSWKTSSWQKTENDVCPSPTRIQKYRLAIPWQKPEAVLTIPVRYWKYCTVVAATVDLSKNPKF